MREEGNMKRMKIPVGISDFKKIREKGSYYIDKTGFIEELLSTGDTEVTLITRPSISHINYLYDSV